MVRIALLALSISFLAAPAGAQGPYWHIQNLNVEGVLPSNSIHCIAKDDKDVIWVGADVGLFRYDGFRFERQDLYSHKDSSSLHNVFRLLIDESGTQYISFLNNGFGVRTREGRFRHFKSPGELPNNSIDYLTDMGDEVLILFEKFGLTVFNKKTERFEHFLPSEMLPSHSRLERFNFLLGAARDPGNPQVVWIAGRAGMFRWDHPKRALEFFPFRTPVNSKASIRSIYIHTNGKAYMGSWNAGLIAFDIRTRKWEIPRIQPNDLNLSVISWTGRKSAQEVWVGTLFEGLCAYNPTTGAIRKVIPFEEKKTFSLNPDRRLDSDVVDMIPFPDQSYVVLKNRNQGMAFLYQEPQLFRKYETGVSMHRPITGMKDTVCLITNQARMLITDPEFSHFHTQAIEPYLHDDGFRHGLRDDAGNCYVLGWKGIYRFKPMQGKATRMVLPLLDSLVQSGVQIVCGHYESPNNRIWIGTTRGLFLLDHPGDRKGRWVTIRDTMLDQPVNWSHFRDVCATPDGKIWFLSDMGFGFSTDGGTSFTLYHAEQIMESGRGVGDFTSLEYDHQGRLWISNEGEDIIYLYYARPHPQPLRFLPKKPDQKVLRYAYHLTRDKNGDIWGIQKSGLFRIRTSDLSLRFFESEYGIPEAELFTLDTFPGGRLYAGSAYSFFIFHPDSLAANELPSNVKISRVQIQGKDQVDTLSYPTSIQAIYASNTFTFYLEPTRHWQKKNIRFQYRLADFHPDWITSPTPEFTLWNIPPGDYRLQVRTFNPSGHFDYGEILELPLRISPPYWQTWWFRVLVLLGFGSLVAGVVMWTLRSRQEKALMDKKVAELKMTALRAQMNPHFIFNALNSIKWLMVNGEQEKMIEYLDHYSLVTRKILDYSNLEMISLEQELEVIRLILEIEKARFKGKFEYLIEVDKDVDIEFFRIPPLLFQPFVENAIWHGLLHKKEGLGRLLIRISSIPNGIHCIIEDNGIGRKEARVLANQPHAASKSHGIKISQERIDQLSRQFFHKASLDFEDLTDETGQAKGTRVILELCP